MKLTDIRNIRHLNPRDALNQVCEFLELDDDNIEEIVIRASLHERARVNVTYVVVQEQDNQ